MSEQDEYDDLFPERARERKEAEQKARVADLIVALEAQQEARAILDKEEPDICQVYYPSPADTPKYGGFLPSPVRGDYRTPKGDSVYFERAGYPNGTHVTVTMRLDDIDIKLMNDVLKGVDRHSEKGFEAFFKRFKAAFIKTVQDS